MALWYLFLLASIAGIAWAVWTYRKSAAEKAAASNARMQELLAIAPRTKSAAVTVATGGPLADAQAVQTAAYVRRESLLNQAQSLLFLRLKSGLPDLEIFAGVSLAAVVDISTTVSGNSPDELRSQLELHHIDFLVCERNSRIVAAVEFAAATDSAKFKSACLAAAGIRHVRVNPRAVPAKEDMDALILGVNPASNT